MLDRFVFHESIRRNIVPRVAFDRTCMDFDADFY
jgi:hypothetical protein